MMEIESSFYHDGEGKKLGMKSIKSNMTLDFNNPNKTKLKKLTDVLSSPDINLLKLASPELERMIINQGALTTTTPTPTTQILFPKSVTEEQEAYARGFVDALAELHGKNGPEDQPGALVTSGIQMPGSNSEMPASSTYTTLTTVSSVSNAPSTMTNGVVTVNGMTNLTKPSTAQSNVYTSAFATLAQLPGSVQVPQSTSSVVSTSQGLSVPQAIVQTQSRTLPLKSTSPPMQFTTSTGQHSQLIQIKDEEPQRVPSLSPQLAPINMEAQESIKLERKRARNRLAARKCRTRKLERISRLEERVAELKGQNTNLVNTASDLREQVFKLKQQILEHVSSGCKVMLSANML